MSRPCSVCGHRNHLRVDKELLEGIPPRDVASKYGIGESAVYRHIRAHLRAGFLVPMDSEISPSAADLIEHLLEALADVRAVRTVAIASGQAGLLLRSTGVTRAIIADLMDRLGIDNVEVARGLQEADEIARALMALVSKHPKVGAALAAELDRAGSSQLASAVSNYASRVHQSQQSSEPSDNEEEISNG